MCESLTYSGRNVSVGRVIGIHRRRIMGSQDSVVVDSDSCDGENVEIKKVRQKKKHKTGDSATDTCTNEYRDMRWKKGHCETLRQTWWTR